jgi:ABC-type polysaccharide/polyol phosphate transport system ATPase subunit
MKTILRVSDVTLEYPLPSRYSTQGIRKSGVRNITFELFEGEVLGIIGRNGSGKSTLLKMLAGVFPPDNGQIYSSGTVSLLAGVGVGFHKELTGRENSYLYGALMGRSKFEIDQLIDEIQNFSELGYHFDRPLRTYSSGMKSRLGISVATSFKPDILLIDEVLGVGDASFKQKSQERVRKLISESGSVIIVSHSYTMLKKICDRILLIDEGENISIGEPDFIIEKYKKILDIG